MAVLLKGFAKKSPSCLVRIVGEYRKDLLGKCDYVRTQFGWRIDTLCSALGVLIGELIECAGDLLDQVLADRLADRRLVVIPAVKPLQEFAFLKTVFGIEVGPKIVMTSPH